MFALEYIFIYGSYKCYCWYNAVQVVTDNNSNVADKLIFDIFFKHFCVRKEKDYTVAMLWLQI